MAGSSFLACRGHAMDAEKCLEAGTVMSLPAATA
jgi:hypothetical protein